MRIVLGLPITILLGLPTLGVTAILVGLPMLPELQILRELRILLVLDNMGLITIDGSVTYATGTTHLRMELKFFFFCLKCPPVGVVTLE